LTDLLPHPQAPCRRRRNLIDGEWKGRRWGNSFPSVNPATGEKVGDVAAADAQDRGYTLKELMGVAALIVPWNDPFVLACYKLAPALAPGCTTILKPAEDTSLNTLNLALR
jgi:acyl-CoA reductase-like NAD-dependent aldehyde dehydrogenase